MTITKTASFVIIKSDITGQYCATITYKQGAKTWTNSTAHAFYPEGARYFAHRQIKAAKAKLVEV